VKEMNNKNPLTFNELKKGDVIYERYIAGISVSRIKSDQIESEDGCFVLIDYDFIYFEDMKDGRLRPNFTNDDDARIYKWYITENGHKYYRDILPALEDTISLLENNLKIAKSALIGLKNETNKP
jgi:hypothetical protein